MTLFYQILQYAISGLTGGSIYAVLGICWSVVYLITRVLNFTTGEFVMLGGMLTWGFHGAGLRPTQLLRYRGHVSSRQVWGPAPPGLVRDRGIRNGHHSGPRRPPFHVPAVIEQGRLRLCTGTQ